MRTRVPNSAAYDPAMLLAVDVGNSNITIGSFRNGALVAVRRAATPRGGTADELELLRRGPAPPRRRGLRATSRRSSCASVVPAVSGGARGRDGAPRPAAAARRRGHGAAPDPGRPAGRGRRGPARQRPGGVARLYGTPAVVVDLGTATTFDCVAARRRLRRRRDRAGHRARARGAGVADREAAAGRAADARSGDRAGHRLGDPERRGPRLPGPGRRAARRASGASSPTPATSRPPTCTSC